MNSKFVNDLCSYRILYPMRYICQSTRTWCIQLRNCDLFKFLVAIEHCHWLNLKFLLRMFDQSAKLNANNFSAFQSSD